MRALCVDTATPIESVALIEDGRLVAERALFRRWGHGPGLLDDIEGALKDVDWALADVDALVCGMGPGSFTGLRIALATLKGLAMGLGKPLYGARTTQLLIAGCAGPRPVAVLDARRGEIFVEGGGIERPVCIAPEALAGLLPEGAPPTLVGSGALVYRDVLLASVPGAQIPAADAQHQARAAFLAGLVDLTAPPPALATLEPSYVRRTDAEINYPDGFPDAIAHNLMAGAGPKRSK